MSVTIVVAYFVKSICLHISFNYCFLLKIV